MTEDEVKALPIDERRRLLVGCLERCSEVLMEFAHEMKKKPLLGGTFGRDGFYLCSDVSTLSGLHQVRYYVFASSGLFFGYGDTRGAAISQARDILEALGKPFGDTLLAAHRAKRAEAMAAERKRLAEIEAEIHSATSKRRGKVSSIPRRRKRIFDECEGKCHYCATPLTLDGKWHIEHKMPQALGGGNEPGNLVAACVPCNMEKRDTTDVEFKAKRAAAKA